MSKRIGTQTRLAAIALAFVVIANAITVGAGLLGDGVGTPLTLDPSVPQMLPGTPTTLTWTSMAQSTCQEQTIPVTGASPGDKVILGVTPVMVGLGVVISQPVVSSTNTVTVEVCKMTTGSVTPPSGNWSAAVLAAGTW